MIAIDTNIVVRLIANDEPRQVARARRLLEENEVLLQTSVLLEGEWVLRSMYGVDRAKMLSSLTAFCALENVVLEEAERVQRALGLHAEGLDFADALHLAGVGGGGEFYTFDKSLRAKASKKADVPRVLEP